MKRILLALAASLAGLAGQAAGHAAPAGKNIASHVAHTHPPAFKTCTVASKAGGDPWRLTLQGGQVRFAEYGHRYPDNVLRVRQSYDRRGKLTGISVAVSGFAGPLLNVRMAADSRGRFLPEQGSRRKGFTEPAAHYLRAAPKGC